jgi:hypothetical protein
LLVTAATGFTVFAANPAFAGPEDREVCANAAEQGQQLRDEGKYRRAREQMLVCAREVCPGAIRSDCGKWLTELDRDAPTVVLGARDQKGSDVMDVKVSLDGAPLIERLDGKPVLVDSGEHTFKFEAKDGSVREERVLLRAAEKARPIIATFGSSSTSTPSGGGGTTAQADQPERSEPSLVPVIIVGAVGVVGLASFATFGIMGKGEVDDLQGCKPNCKQADVDKARTKLIIADISLGVGVVALGVAAFMYLTRPKVEAKTQMGTSVRFDAGPVPGGGTAGLVGTF